MTGSPWFDTRSHFADFPATESLFRFHLAPISRSPLRDHPRPLLGFLFRSSLRGFSTSCAWISSSKNLRKDLLRSQSGVEIRVALSGSPILFTWPRLPTRPYGLAFVWVPAPIPGSPQWFFFLSHLICLPKFPFDRVPRLTPPAANSESPWGSPFFVT